MMELAIQAYIVVPRTPHGAGGSELGALHELGCFDGFSSVIM